MEIKEVDPYKVNVDEMNERTENLNLGDLERSIAEQGVIQPPIVRERNGDAEVPYSVVVGQRRTLAAQGAGLSSMPVIVMDFDDADALEASITENVQAFREDVSRKDRAFAIERLKDMSGMDNTQVADSLGVGPDTVSQWLEYTRDEWEGTAIHPEMSGSENRDVSEMSGVIEDMSPDILKNVRRVTGGGKEGQELVERVAEHDLNKDDVRELAKKVERGQGVDQALGYVIEEKHSTGDIKVKANVTFSGGKASALTEFAKDRGMSENEVVRQAIEDYLSREGYL